MRSVPTSAYMPKLERWGVPLLEEGLFVAGPLALFLAELEMKEQAALRDEPDPTQ